MNINNTLMKLVKDYNYVNILDINWCGTPVSNRRPSAWQADALPTELVPHWLDNILFNRVAFNNIKSSLWQKYFLQINEFSSDISP